MQAEANPGSPALGACDEASGWTALPSSASTLAAHHRGGPSRRRITMVHGFAQTGRCFGPLAAALGDLYDVTAVDAPGHGGSLRHMDADLWTGADLLMTGPEPRVLLGYSMGARLALHAALAHPSRVAALVLIGATAGLEDPDLRRARRASDETLARRLETEGLDAFLAEWLAMPMFSGLPEWARFDEERRGNTAAGLASSLRHAGTGSMLPLWDRMPEITCPVLLVTGADDLAYTELARRLERAVSGPTRRVEVDDAGHAAHLEAPRRVIDEVVAAVDRAV